jgi:hypothetical protein
VANGATRHGPAAGSPGGNDITSPSVPGSTGRERVTASARDAVS